MIELLIRLVILVKLMLGMINLIIDLFFDLFGCGELLLYVFGIVVWVYCKGKLCFV